MHYRNSKEIMAANTNLKIVKPKIDNAIEKRNDGEEDSGKDTVNGNGKRPRSESVNSNTEDDVSKCICLKTWEEILGEQNSMKIYLLEVIQDHPTILQQDILQILVNKNEEATREINQLIQDKCRRCGRMHETWFRRNVEGYLEFTCKDEEGNYVESFGCDSLHHHDLK